MKKRWWAGEQVSMLKAIGEQTVTINSWRAISKANSGFMEQSKKKALFSTVGKEAGSGQPVFAPLSV